VDDFAPAANWSYVITGLAGYQDVAAGNFEEYIDPEGLTVRTDNLTIANPFTYTFDLGLVGEGGLWTASYAGCDADCFGAVGASLEWSRGFPQLSVTATAQGGSYLEAFRVGLTRQPLAGDASVASHTWIDQRTIRANVTLIAATAVPEQETARIVGSPKAGLEIDGFSPAIASQCQASAATTDGVAHVYYCTEAGFGTHLPPAISARDSSETVAMEFDGTYEDSIEIGTSSTGGTYYTQELSSNQRTVTKWELAEDFQIEVAQFAWVEIGTATDSSYSVTAAPEAGATGLCSTTGTTYKARCWLRRGAQAEITVSPVAGRYLRSVKVSGASEDLSSVDPGTGAYTFLATVPDTAQAQVTVSTANPVESTEHAGALLGSPSVLRLVCQTSEDPAFTFCTGPDTTSVPAGETQVVSLSTDGSSAITYWTNHSIDGLAFALEPTPGTSRQISLGLHGGYDDRIALADAAEIDTVYVKYVNSSLEVTVTKVALMVGTVNAGFRLAWDQAQDGAPVLTGIPVNSAKPVMDPVTGVSSWHVAGLAASDAGSGVRSVVWFKRSNPVLSDADAARVVAQSKLSPASPPDPAAELGTCSGAGAGVACDIATGATGSGRLDVVFYAVDHSDNISDPGDPADLSEPSDRLTLYYDWIGPVITDGFWVQGGPCEGDQLVAV
ncbi:MAG: hypothetical protein LBK95_19190, partial [Bifidobacteriaceae bacterium]|nr:hypothetical protein [Bifidobacteriaceae bacterium]